MEPAACCLVFPEVDAVALPRAGACEPGVFDSMAATRLVDSAGAGDSDDAMSVWVEADSTSGAAENTAHAIGVVVHVVHEFRVEPAKETFLLMVFGGGRFQQCGAQCGRED